MATHDLWWLPVEQAVAIRQESRRGHARAAIEAAIAAEPGLSKSNLCKRTGLAWGTVWYHVRQLEENGLVCMLGRSGQGHIFPSSMQQRRLRWLAALKGDSARRVLGIVATRPQLTIAETSRLSQLSPGVIKSRLIEFAALGIVETHGAGRPRFIARREGLATAYAVLEELGYPLSTDATVRVPAS